MKCPYCNNSCQNYDPPHGFWQCTNHQSKPIFLNWNDYKVTYPPSEYMEISYFSKDTGWLVFSPNKNELYIDLLDLRIPLGKLVTPDNLKSVLIKLDKLKAFI